MSHSRDQLLQAHASARVYQERYDQAFQPWGMRAPEPTIGGPVDAYRRDLAVKAKRLLPDKHELKPVQFRGLADDVLDRFEPQLLKDCRNAAYSNDSVPAGEMRCVERIDTNGMKWKEYYGKECFVKQMTTPGRLVLGFRTDQGFMNTSGRFRR